MDQGSATRTNPILVMAIGGTVMGIDSATGEVRWTHELQAVQAPTALVVTETRIFACNSPRLVCLNYPAGDERWSAKVDNGVAPTLLLEGGLLYVATAKGHLECFTLDGEPRWHNPLKGKGTGGTTLGVPGRVSQGPYWR